MVSSGPPPDGQRFDETMGRARQRLAAMHRAGDELAALTKGSVRNHAHVLDDLLEDLGTG